VLLLPWTVEMVSFSLARLAAVVSGFLLFARVSSVPTDATAFDGLGKEARDILTRATPAAPHWVIYGDQFVSGTTGPPNASVVAVRRTTTISANVLENFTCQ
jgi:hypothetical protein